jgi:LmbE family N-acetylglucosaminyl deacetylase
MISTFQSAVRRSISVRLILGVALIFIIILAAVHSHFNVTNDVTIVLSPHYDDAVLSLGGLLAEKGNKAIVASFFTGIPQVATSTSWDTKSGFSNSTEAMNARIIENQNALKVLGTRMLNLDYLDNQYRLEEEKTADKNAILEQELAKDIQALIASYGQKTIYVYGPALFGPVITHPDHALLHAAFLDVIRSFPNNNVHFYFYEDYPYVERYNREVVTSLKKNLEQDSQNLLTTTEIPLTGSDVKKKISALKRYVSQTEVIKIEDHIDVIKNTETFTSTRCGSEGACEVVYEIVRF